MTETTARYRMTRYELIRALSSRAEQISTGSSVCTEIKPGDNPLAIAIRELENQVLPLKLEREFPDGSRVILRLSEMIIPVKTMQHIKSLRLLQPEDQPELTPLTDIG